LPLWQSSTQLCPEILELQYHFPRRQRQQSSFLLQSVYFCSPQSIHRTLTRRKYSLASCLGYWWIHHHSVWIQNSSCQNLRIDRFSGPNAKLSHSCKGILTHRFLDVTPAFGITNRAASSSLDATHTVFAQGLWNDKTA
jgi:hypothetical protein